MTGNPHWVVDELQKEAARLEALGAHWGKCSDWAADELRRELSNQYWKLRRSTLLRAADLRREAHAIGLKLLEAQRGNR